MEGKVGRKPKYESLGYSELEFKELLLKLYVDEDYNKVSDRELLEKLMDYGFVNENKHSKIERPVSLGTLSSWKENLELQEFDIYDFYKEHIDITYDEWSKVCNRGNKNSYHNKLDSEKIRWKMLQYFGLPNMRQSLSELETVIKSMYNTLGIDGESAIAEFYNDFKKGVV